MVFPLEKKIVLALEREMTRSFAVYMGLISNQWEIRDLFTKANCAESKWDRDFYPLIDLSSLFMQACTTAG